MSSRTPHEPDFHDLELIDALSAALTAPTPVDLLGIASALVATADDGFDEPRYDFFHPGPDHRPDVPTDLHRLAGMFLEAGAPETDAVLRVWAEMLGDEFLAKRITTGLKSRTRSGPDWLARIDETTAVGAASMTAVLGHEETILLGLETAGLEYTFAVAVEHSGIPFLQDAYPIDSALADVHAAIAAELGEEARIDRLPLADAGARIHSAAYAEDRIRPRVETDTWPAMQSLLDWVVSLIPAGGRGFEKHEWTPAEIDELVADFMASPWAEGLGRDGAMHAERLLGFQADHGSGEPLRWGGVFVASVMHDLYPRKVIADDDFMLAMPTTLRALVQYANHRSGVPEQFTQNALAAIHDLEDEYRAGVLESGDAPTAIEATQEQFMSLLGGSGLMIDLYESMLWELEEEVGGPDVLQSLGVEPLPHEELDISQIPEDLHPRVRSLADQVAALAETAFDNPEMRTSALRILAAAAANGPEVFRRRFTDPPTVAAVCWIAGKINHWFVQSDPARTASTLMHHAGVKSSPAHRASALRSAIRPASQDDSEDASWDPAASWLLGDPALLTSTARTRVAEARDRFTAELELLHEDGTTA